MRVITGKYKGRRFDIPPRFKARPTTDFAKENLFNVLRGYVDFEGLRAADLFAGTGSISLELLSRGCSHVVAVELDAMHFGLIRDIVNKLDDHNVSVVRGDVLRFVPRCKETFDLVFADPPYALKELTRLPDMILQSNLLEKGGLLVLEHGRDHNFSDHPAFVEHREYGSVNFSFFRKG